MRSIYPEAGKFGLTTGSFAVTPFLDKRGVHLISESFMNSMGDGLDLCQAVVYFGVSKTSIDLGRLSWRGL